MKKSEKRVLIAKDVLAGLKAKRFRARQNVYVLAKKQIYRENEPDETQLQACFAKMDHCDVCAYGAVFVAAVERFDNFQVGAIRSQEYFFDRAMSKNSYIDCYYFDDYMQKIFTTKQLELIETAFEKHATYFGEDHNHYVQIQKSKALGMKHKTAEKRMIAIMENIIENNGIFKP